MARVAFRHRPGPGRCHLGEDAELLEADEYANRSEIHPCRAPWEVACVEPDGDARIVDFFGPVIGNIAEAPLGEIWNAPEARTERARSHRARICGLAGPVVCEPDPSR
jgi:MoaA/NifB/PqqE/SkfB family radical SAM enzyme